LPPPQRAGPSTRQRTTRTAMPGANEHCRRGAGARSRS
jgi:hypothetical protein